MTTKCFEAEGLLTEVIGVIRLEEVIRICLIKMVSTKSKYIDK